MSIEFDSDNAGLHSHRLKLHRLCFDVTIGSNATPASKTHSSDLPSAVYLRTEGKTSEADAVEDASSDFSTAADATGIFGILIDDPTVQKIYKVDLQVDTGTIALGSNGASVTSGGRIALDLDSNQTLASQDITVTVCMDYFKRD